MWGEWRTQDFLSKYCMGNCHKEKEVQDAPNCDTKTSAKEPSRNFVSTKRSGHRWQRTEMNGDQKSLMGQYPMKRTGSKLPRNQDKEERILQVMRHSTHCWIASSAGDHANQGQDLPVMKGTAPERARYQDTKCLRQARTSLLTVGLTRSGNCVLKLDPGRLFPFQPNDGHIYTFSPVRRKRPYIYSTCDLL